MIPHRKRRNNDPVCSSVRRRFCRTFLIAIFCLFCCASASADFVLPAGTTDIADEAFMDARLSYCLTIPEGVQTIGHQAFLGTRAMQVKLPASLTFIAPDAFAPAIEDIFPHHRADCDRLQRG